ncbi:MAG: aldolase/citrate lyase family protein [Bacteroidota bacterium]
MKNLKERIKSGEAVHGCWINLGSAVSAEIIGQAGFDWVLIDLEHGAGNDSTMLMQLQALSGTNATPIVRTDEAGRSKVQRILDFGATGIMFPQVQDPEEAKSAVSLMYYPPHGTRGMAKMVRATSFGTKIEEYAAGLDKNLVGVIQIETINSLKHLDTIAALKEVDVLFVGPSDLSLALGIFNQVNHPEFQQAIKAVAAAAKKHGKAAGILLQDMSEYKMYFDLGYRFIACGGRCLLRYARRKGHDKKYESSVS